MALLAIAVLALQASPVPAEAPPAAPPPAAALPAGPSREVTVVERAGNDRQQVPLNSRIARTATDNLADDPAAAMYLREWADCIVRVHRPRALSLLATPLNSAEQTRIVNQITGHRFTRRTVCARFRSMRVDNLVLRGAIAEALWRWEDRRRRSAGPLAVVPPVAADSSDRPLLLARMGRCVVERDAEAAARVMATRPGTRSSREALAALSPGVSACMPAGVRLRDVHPLTLRGALGEAYYLKRRSAAEEQAPAASSSPDA